MEGLSSKGISGKIKYPIFSGQVYKSLLSSSFSAKVGRRGGGLQKIRCFIHLFSIHLFCSIFQGEAESLPSDAQFKFNSW